jgi:hypothetical protein
LNVEDGKGKRIDIFHRENQDVSLKHPSASVKIGPLMPCMPALVSLMPAASPALSLIAPFLSTLGAIRYYPLEPDDDAVWSVVLESAYRKWLAEYRATSNPGDSVLLRLLHLSLVNPGQLDEVKALVGRNGLELVDGIDVHSFTPPGQIARQEETDKLHVFGFQPSHQQRYFRLGDLSAGTQRIIRLIVSLIFDKSAVMLVEHPEDTIHRGLLRKLIDLLRAYSDQSQLILSSHSSVVFNTLDPTAIRLVTMEDGNTRVRPLTGDELSAAGKFMEEEGSLADFIETVEEG